MQGEARVSPVLISSHKISKKPYVQSLQRKTGGKSVRRVIIIQEAVIDTGGYQKENTVFMIQIMTRCKIMEKLIPRHP